MKLFFKSLLLTIISIIFLVLIFTLLSYFNIIKYTKLTRLLILLFGILIGGFYLGKNTRKKGWFNGLKLGLCLVMISLIPTIIIAEFKTNLLVYYGIILFMSILSSCLGITQKKETT
jgi:putative membrane protein (TIGR04086 family)